jgi:hypothetical protein
MLFMTANRQILCSSPDGVQGNQMTTTTCESSTTAVTVSHCRPNTSGKSSVARMLKFVTQSRTACTLCRVVRGKRCGTAFPSGCRRLAHDGSSGPAESGGFSLQIKPHTFTSAMRAEDARTKGAAFHGQCSCDGSLKNHTRRRLT